MTTAMKIRALAPWFGCKRALAPVIVEQLGPHGVYWEPFCGSCAVLFAKERVSNEAVNDLHDDLINLALIVQDAATAPRLYDRVSRTLFHEKLLLAAKAALLKPFTADLAAPCQERAYWYVVASWMGMNGLAGTAQRGPRRSVAARYSAKGGAPATRWASVGESIPDWHERLIGVQILSRDGFALLAKIDDADGTAIYVDPPYVTKGAAYVHDFKPDDHARLAEILRRFKHARCVVSYYDHPSLAELYRGWSKLECTMTKAMVQGGRRDQNGRTDAPEILYVNGPLMSGSAQPDLFGGDA